MDHKINIVMCAYIETYGNYGMILRKPLKPTGRWKIGSGPYYVRQLFIEHQGRFFKSWIDEDSIVFAAKEHSMTFSCA